MESSLSAGRTRRTSSLGRLSDHASKENGTRNNTDEFHDRPPVPTLLGYEVMEERAKFTVYKILVRRAPDESWVVFRRYTDFSRLNNKLKEMFPKFKLSLPPKRRFKDNYDMNFLEERQVGLQAFLQNLVAQKDMTESDVVRGFLCLDDPPGPFDSLEESKAYCETLEETNYRLQRELQDKQREIESLRRILEDRELQIGQLEKTKKDHQSRSCDSSRDRRTGRPGQQFHAPFGKEKPRCMLELLRFRRPRTCELPQINMSSGPGLEIPLSVFKENSCKESTDLNT